MAGLGEYVAALGLIFGGCCSNALTLGMITSQFPPSGSFVTFAQFLVVSIVGLRKQVVVLPKRAPRDETIRRICSEISQRKDRMDRPAVYVHCVDTPRGQAFTQQLSTSMKSTLTGIEISLGDKSVQNVSEKPFYIEIASPTSWSQAYNSKHADLTIDISHPERPALWIPNRRQFTVNPFRLRLKPRRIPIARYAIQVLLFLLISLLNNAAFAYRVPMAVHIIFRSGGLVVNLLMGWIIEKRRYTKLQVGSVLLVTLGVAVTTLSATLSKPRRTQSVSAMGIGEGISSYWTYAMGIGILTLALILSGFLGLSQDKTFEKYGRGNWEEAMFYLHAMSLPLFSLVKSELASQIKMANSCPSAELGVHSLFQPMKSTINSPSTLPPLPYLPLQLPTLRVPSFYIPLALNVLTQFVCVSGVNRLTSRVNSLTVTLVLVVRKAVSLAISVLFLGNSRGNWLLWIGAVLVLVGTVGYTMGNAKSPKKIE